jgi:hypothetical protein
VIHDARVEIGTRDTRAIYALGEAAAEEALRNAVEAEPDVVLLSGTGMPTTSLLDPDGRPPVLSSNLCLAEAMIATSETGNDRNRHQLHRWSFHRWSRGDQAASDQSA